MPLASPLRRALVSGRLWLWLAPGLLWAGFCLWYTNTLGPLTSAEIESLTQRMASADAPAERVETIRRFMETDDGGQFLMVNLLDMADDADAVANMDRYMAHMLRAMLRRASHPILVGSAVNTAMDVAGIEDAEQWSSVGIVRYRSRRDILAIALDPAFGTEHDFKLAALAKTIAVPIEPDLHLGDLRLLLLLVCLSVVGVVNAIWRRTSPKRDPVTP